MVKRKADVSIDEWLGGGTSLPVANQAATIAAEEKPASSSDPTAEVTSNSLTAEVVTAPVPTGPVIAPVTDVAVSVEDEGHWFWALLEESGYKRW